MTIGERIRLVRKCKDINLTLDKFGERIGMKKSSLSQVENGINSATDQTIKSVCREFNVNYIWLMTGDGEMFLHDESSMMEKIDQIMYGENEFHKNLIKMTVDLSMEELKVIEGILDKYIDLKKEKSR